MTAIAIVTKKIAVVVTVITTKVNCKSAFVQIYDKNVKKCKRTLKKAFFFAYFCLPKSLAFAIINAGLIRTRLLFAGCALFEEKGKGMTAGR
ncbi:MAG: hypothetical protein J6R37_02950 [Clostridia bacterium]|nr:hypothetical protein [Clostridia bacterium]